MAKAHIFKTGDKVRLKDTAFQKASSGDFVGETISYTISRVWGDCILEMDNDIRLVGVRGYISAFLFELTPDGNEETFGADKNPMLTEIPVKHMLRVEALDITTTNRAVISLVKDDTNRDGSVRLQLGGGRSNKNWLWAEDCDDLAKYFTDLAAALRTVYTPPVS